MPIDFVHMNGDSFEDMCAALFQAEHGAIPIKANPGDGGIDSFRGSLLEGVSHIWQYKHFPDGIDKTQKSQIRDSLKTAAGNYHPKRWTLVVPCDLDTGAQKWLVSRRVRGMDDGASASIHSRRACFRVARGYEAPMHASTRTDVSPGPLRQDASSENQEAGGR